MTARPLTRSEERARQQGLEAASPDLPVTARSLTPDEVRANDGRVMMIVFGVYLAVTLLLTLLVLVGDGLPVWAAPAALFMAIPVGLFVRARARRRSDYRDPGIEVTVGKNAVTVRDAQHSATIDFAELSGCRISHYSSKTAVIFLGIELETPSGPLKLEEGWFKGGTRAAATIVKQLDARGLPLAGRPTRSGR